MKLSIIVPAYNVGKYLDDCISSCFRQDLSTDDYEVIIINDGSTDRTLELALNWKERHTNITVISQENKGLSEARNAGMKASQGEYIMFLDSDDWISDNCLGKLTERCDADDLDMLRIAAARVAGDTPQQLFSYKGKDKIESGRSLLMTKVNISAPLAIYRRKLLLDNGLKFHPGIFHEDNEFTPRAYYHAERVGSTNDIIYFVRQTQGSITRSINPKKCHDLLTVAERLETFAEETVEEKYRSGIYMQAANCVNWCLNGMQTLPEEEVSRLKEILRKKKHLTGYFFRSCSVLHHIEGVLFRLFPCRILEIYRKLDLIHYKERRKR